MTALRLFRQRLNEVGAKDGVLGSAALASAPGTVAWPEQRLHLGAETGADAAWREAWGTDSPVSAGHEAGLRWRAGPELLYGVIELDEPLPGQGPSLRDRTREAYARIFALLQSRGLPHLWRVWNYMADIHGDEDGLERYRSFNLGRHDAFVAAGRATDRAMPAASALGSGPGPLSIAFLAGRSAPRPIENPRQLSAFRYPGDYGPRPPLFARAALAQAGAEEWLFVSGTASILGHQTVHLGDVVAQCEETARNILAVLEQANHATRSAGHRADALIHRAYVRHRADMPSVRRCLERCLPGASLTLMQADVCRADLLIEVESVASAPCLT